MIVEEIRVLCDVRKNAYSQKYGFSKTPLERACVGVVIQYIHISALGIESNKRQNLQSLKDYDVLFDEYEKYILSNRTDELSFIDNLLKNSRVALTCFEKPLKQCHRSRVANKLLEISDDNYTFKQKVEISIPLWEPH